MIGFLKGTNIYTGKDYIILNTGSVGYKVYVTPATKLKKEMGLFIHTKVSDSDIALFGFVTQEEIGTFESLIKVSGVGPKIALAILSATSVANINKAIASSDVSFFTAIPGLGKKGAQKIIVELKGKKEADINLSQTDQTSDLYQALLNLGFKSNEINSVITKIDADTSLQDQIKQALKLLR
jgi:holliday junction DNA helicase RuvA